jgi:dodecin
MSVGRVTEIIATSSKSFDDAVEEGVKRATKTLENVTSAWVKDQSFDIKKDKIVAYKVTFILK